MKPTLLLAGPVSILLLLPGTGACQTVQGEVLTAHDSQGSIYMAYNVADEGSGAVRILRLNSAGALLWSRERRGASSEVVFSAAMDSKGNLLLAGLRRDSVGKTFSLLKYGPGGELLWEAADSRHDCTATRVVVDDGDAVLVAGICRSEALFPARLLKFDRGGGLLWAQEYDGGGRNYVRSLSSFRGDTALTVETVAGSYGTASNVIQVLVYDRGGQRVRQ